MTWFPCLVRSSPGRGARPATRWAIHWSIVLGVRGGPGPAEHGAGDGVRLEGVLHVSWARSRSRSSRRTCWTSSPPSAATARWCGSATASRACRRGRSPGGLASVSGFYAYVVARGDTPVRREPGASGAGDPPAGRKAPEGAAGAGAAHAPEGAQPGGGAGRCWRRCARHRDRAMVEAMVLGGLRRCEVLGLTPRGPAGGGAVAVHRRGQGRPPAGGADLRTRSSQRRRLPRPRAPRDGRTRIGCSWR